MSKDLVSGAIFLAASVAFYLLAAAFPVSALDTSVSSAAFPEMLAIAGGALSLLLIVMALVKGRVAKPVAVAVAGAPVEEDKDENGFDKAITHKRALGLLAILSVYIAILGPLGYLLSVFLLINVVAFYHGIKASWRLLAVAAIGSLFFWTLFDQILGVRMPSGILPF
jgi:putative tricarboxylic transport membrane protein